MSSNLERIRTVSTIVGAILTPVTIALVGAWIQSSVADRGIERDYAEMAISILRGTDPKEQDLRAWALQVLDETSPIRVTGDTRAKLLAGIGVSPIVGFTRKIPDEFFTEPQRWTEMPAETVTEAQLNENLRANHRAFHQNLAQLESLIGVVRMTQEHEASLALDLLRLDEEIARKREPEP